MNTLADRIKEALTDAGRTQADLAEACNIKPPSVSEWVSGKTKSLKAATAQRAAAFLGVNMMWLTEGRGPKRQLSSEEVHTASENASALLPSDNVQPLIQPPESHDHKKGRSMGRANVVPITGHAESEEFVIHQYAAGGSMGHGLVLPEQPGVIERWTVSNEWLEKNVRNYTAKKNLCIVTGFGPSMQPMFNPGDPLLVDTGITRVHADGVYFFRIGDEGYIKQLQKLPKPGGGVIYRAKSANPAYDTFDVDETYDFEVLGKVVRVWCGTDF